MLWKINLAFSNNWVKFVINFFCVLLPLVILFCGLEVLKTNSMLQHIVKAKSHLLFEYILISLSIFQLTH